MSRPDQVNYRVTPTQKAAWEARAASLGLTVSEWIKGLADKDAGTPQEVVAGEKALWHEAREKKKLAGIRMRTFAYRAWRRDNPPPPRPKKPRPPKPLVKMITRPMRYRRGIEKKVPKPRLGRRPEKPMVPDLAPMPTPKPCPPPNPLASLFSRLPSKPSTDLSKPQAR